MQCVPMNAYTLLQYYFGNNVQLSRLQFSHPFFKNFAFKGNNFSKSGLQIDKYLIN